MNMDKSSNTGVETRMFSYNPVQFIAWRSAHARWWPRRKDPAVWGQFGAKAAGGRCTFSQVNQPDRHFAETLVASIFEQQGYVCWTCAKVFREPGRAVRGFRGLNTRLVEALLSSSLGLVPQERYEAEYMGGLRLKNVDVVGFHARRNHWLFAEAKKDSDRLLSEQEAALRFLQRILPFGSADAFVALVRPEQEDAG